MESRPYRKVRRSELEQETHRRITESTVELHRTVGPSRTTISAIADHAGVRRSTVYRHFPDDESLFDACTAHWNAANPTPDLGAWAAVGDPRQRLERALGELYALYRREAPMIANLIRDAAEMPIVQRHFAPFSDYLAQAARVLLTGWPPDDRVSAAVGHALSFTTWRSLTNEQELDDTQAVELMCRLVAAARE